MAMRMLALALVAPLLTMAMPAAGSEHLPPAASEAAAEDGEESRRARLDALFETLASAEDERAAKAAEREIIELWLRSGSDTADLLMKWALAAMDSEDYPLALDYLDRITTLKPDYIEGWNKRATVFFLIEDYAKSIADIERVLALEPRHFGALSGLGMIMRDIGESEWAAEAFRRALAVDPLLDNVRAALEALEEKTGAGEGRPI